MEEVLKNWCLILSLDNVTAVKLFSFHELSSYESKYQDNEILRRLK